MSTKLRIAVGLPTLVVALACGLDGPPTPGPGEVVVVVAGRDLAPGDVLTPADLSWASLDADYVPDSATFGVDELVGQTLRHGLPADYMFRAERIEGEDPPPRPRPGEAELADPVLGRLIRGATTVDVLRVDPAAASCLVAPGLVARPTAAGVRLSGDDDDLAAVLAMAPAQRVVVLRGPRAGPAPVAPCLVEAP